MHQDLAECRANLYRLLSTAYIQIPQRETLETKWEPAAKLLEFSREGTEKALSEAQKGLRLIRAYALFGNEISEQCLINLSKDWTRLFRGVERNGLLPPYESLYRTGRLQEKPAQEIYRLFSLMGVRVPEEWHQPSDYIGVELDFMRFLCAKEHQAWEKQEMDSLLEVAEKERSFLEDHLDLWISDFCEKMAEQAHEDFYRGIARLTTGLIGYDQIWVSHLLGMIHSGRGVR